MTRVLVLATHPRPRLADQSHDFFRLKEMKGGGAPKRRNCPVGPRHALRCCHLLALRAKPRVQRDALAFRRSTAALAEALTPQLSSGPRFLEPPGANGRTLPGASAASSSRTGHSAGRAGPEAARVRSVSFRPRGPLPLPQSGAPS